MIITDEGWMVAEQERWVRGSFRVQPVVRVSRPRRDFTAEQMMVANRWAAKRQEGAKR